MITQERLMEKIGALPPGKLSEVEDFVDFISTRVSPEIRSRRAAKIAEYVAANAGTEFDLDETLEAAGIESLLAIDEAPEK